MNRRYIISLSALTALGLALLPSNAISQKKSLKEQLVGTWTLVSANQVSKEGINRTAGVRTRGDAQYSRRMVVTHS
jgi:hypothetical protein